MIDVLDMIGGDHDADAEEGDPAEPIGDEADAAWVEWDKMRGSQKRGPNCTVGEEDDEEDDPAGQCDEDGVNTDFASARGVGAGCTISDPDFGVDDQPCDEPYQDLENEQMGQDVPMLHVLSVEHNVFTDKRVPLGIGNLQSSFRTNGGEVVSAESGGSVQLQGGWLADPARRAGLRLRRLLWPSKPTYPSTAPRFRRRGAFPLGFRWVTSACRFSIER